MAAVEREFAAVSPPGNTYGFHSTEAVEVKVDSTLKPLVIALWVFAGVALLAALLIAVQLISRQLGDAADDLVILRAFGADETALVSDGLYGLMAAIVLGALLAAVVAVALSPLSPSGRCERSIPVRPSRLDWTVLGFGVLVLVVVLGVAAAVHGLAERAPSGRAAGRGGAPNASRTVQAVASAGLPVPTLVGVRFALERGRGRTAVPVRSTLLGAVLAVALVVSTLTFGSGLQSLVSTAGAVRMELHLSAQRQQHHPAEGPHAPRPHPDVVAWDGYDYNDAEIDGQGVPFLFEYGHSATKAPISPPVLSGHAVNGNRQIVLGAATLAQLHKHLGDTVLVSYGTTAGPPPTSPRAPMWWSGRRPCRRSDSPVSSTTTRRWGPARSSPWPACPRRSRRRRRARSRRSTVPTWSSCGCAPG